MIDRLLNTSELATSQIQEITSFHTNKMSTSIFFFELFSKWVNLYFYLIFDIESKSSHLRYCLIFSSLNLMMQKVRLWPWRGIFFFTKINFSKIIQLTSETFKRVQKFKTLSKVQVWERCNIWVMLEAYV